MEKWFEASLSSLIAITTSAVGIYAAIIIFTRLAGKRSFSKMSSFDFAMTVAVGSIIATTVLSASVSLFQGVVGLAAFFRRFSWFQEAIDNTPLLLMERQTILHENLKKARVTEGNLRSKLREANVLDLSQVRAVVFETTGDISVLHTSDENMELEDWLTKDVMRK